MKRGWVRLREGDEWVKDKGVDGQNGGENGWPR